MKLYEIIIKPTSDFGTPLKGDTIFGHFCWQAYYDPSLLNGGIDRWIDCYDKRPFAVFSSAWPKFYDKNKGWYAIKRPDLPMHYLFDTSNKPKKIQLKEAKDNKKKKWMKLKDDFMLDLHNTEYLADKDIKDALGSQVDDDPGNTISDGGCTDFCVEHERQHNTINRLTMTTGEDIFAPFTENAFLYYPQTELAIFVLIDEEATDIERIKKGIKRIGQFGFGKDASTGCGRFGMAEDDEIILPDVNNANACYTLAPVVPEKARFTQSYFSPFVRYGKHGDKYALSGRPFKNPVIMADEGAVFVPGNDNIFKKSYIGKALNGLSKIESKTVHQGYAPYLPFRLELKDE